MVPTTLRPSTLSPPSTPSPPNPLPNEDDVDETPQTAHKREVEVDAVLVAIVETRLNAEVYDEGDEIVLPLTGAADIIP